MSLTDPHHSTERLGAPSRILTAVLKEPVKEAVAEAFAEKPELRPQWRPPPARSHTADESNGSRDSRSTAVRWGVLLGLVAVSILALRKMRSSEDDRTKDRRYRTEPSPSSATDENSRVDFATDATDSEPDRQDASSSTSP